MTSMLQLAFLVPVSKFQLFSSLIYSILMNIPAYYTDIMLIHLHILIQLKRKHKSRLCFNMKDATDDPHLHLQPGDHGYYLNNVPKAAILKRATAP